jgi:homoserine dehydrogenase
VLLAGKDLITANKAMVSHKLPELIALEERTGRRVLFESAVAANIPILHALDSWFGHDWLTSIRGILNGTTNYILERMARYQEPFALAVQDAIAAGYAELDPTADVGGGDARNKLNILLAKAFGVWAQPDTLLASGIQSIQPKDFEFAQKHGWKVKQLAIGQKVGDTLFAAVIPAFVDSLDPLWQVGGEFNGVLLRDAFGEEHFFKGKGAGGETTGAAIHADLQLWAEGYAYGWKKWRRNVFLKHRQDAEWPIYLRYQHPAVLSAIPFSEVWLQEGGAGEGTIVGKVRLDRLKNFVDHGPNETAFWALLPEGISKKDLRNEEPIHAEMIAG